MAGFYGKLPTKGDFLHRNLPRDFVDCWDDWLQTGMQESRQSLGDDWLQTYLTSPLWRYVFAPGVCGSEARAGVMMPSMDRVGRYFPMTVAVSLPAPLSPLTIASRGRTWFESVEACLLEALDDEALDLDAFDERLQSIEFQPEAAGLPDVAAAVGQGLRAGLDDTLDIPAALFPVTAAALDASLQDCSLWWGHGSEQVAPSLVFCRGLPGPGRFTALLDGNWAGHGWQDGAGSPVNYPEPFGAATGG
jgi:type VI secretion system protein ImpM